MQNRRDFLKKASLLLAGGVVAPQFISSNVAHVAADAKKRIGLQLYSLREMVKDDGIQAVLEAVAQMGYTHVETAGYDDGKIYGLDPKDFKQRLDDLGMRCTSAHLGPDYSKDKEAEIMAWWDKAVEAYNQVGAKYLVKPSMPFNEKTTADDLKIYCDYYNSVGYKAAAASMAFGYHNHDFEFKFKFDGKTGYDFLLDNVSPQHVFFQMDVYWVMMAGYDPAKYLKERPRQFKCIHIKDEMEIGASGKMDFQAIFEQMKANRVKDWYVEVENYTNNDPVESVQESYDFLKNAAYVY
ncbi:sugar phosphate isomerase/epimerase [Parabacteroides sp. PF5-6]|uniref:sugar phosphate isomerase/epimerase family protein n=1 Tax=Parabacteroides sp. PF5-6 TaxID=1742403 RepID=UPI00240673CC|nr:sugar phosphate isomerase/epimerase [Parabacteroides sp. PF5-6]MDF9829727.1 sugar phosphate isomerase/epimerase [Parabacteroides sp. PF5-6]